MRWAAPLLALCLLALGCVEEPPTARAVAHERWEALYVDELPPEVAERGHAYINELFDELESKELSDAALTPDEAVNKVFARIVREQAEGSENYEDFQKLDATPDS